MTAVETEVEIRAIAAGGDGVAALPDGRTVFVPRAAPGDRLRLRELRLHARFARAEIEEVVVAGPGRVEPPCPHYVADRCGSCQLMHLAAPVQREAKSRIVGDALRRLARVDIADPVVVPSRADFRYRSKITLAMQQGRMGYHRVNRPTQVFELVDCLIASDPVRALHAAVRAARRHLPRDSARVVLRIDRQGHPHVIVLSDAGDSWTGGKPLHRALHDAGVEVTVWWQPEGGKARAVAGAPDPWPATVFEQVHPAMGDLVRRTALDRLGDRAGQIVWDLYSGIGETTSLLASRGAVVHSVESDRRAVAAAEAAGPPGQTRHTGLVENVVSTLPPPDAVITNPPRAGMAPAAIAALRATRAARIVYVSCDPATLARDVSRLGPEYSLRAVEAFDQFPQTAHVESIAVLERQ